MDERLVRLFVDASRDGPVPGEFIQKVRRLRDMQRRVDARSGRRSQVDACVVHARSEERA